MGIKYNYSADYKVIGRIKDGTSIISYVIRDRQGKKEVVDKKTFEQMVLDKLIYNCYAQIYKDSVNLRGIGIKLTDLPSYQMSRKSNRGIDRNGNIQ